MNVEPHAPIRSLTNRELFSSPLRTLTTPSARMRPLLEVRELSVVFNVGRRRPELRAVDGVSFDVAPRETVALVGESGSGKTTIARAILGLVPIAHGSISLGERDITRLSYRERRRLSADLQAVFQDPYSSLNPTRTVGQSLGEALRANKSVSKSATEARVRLLLERVGLTPDAANRYPSRFSGGQRQRIAIARALMADPSLVICDEPTSALDLSVQAQVLNLLRSLQQELELSYLFISHDLAVVRHLARRIIVLYRGRVMRGRRGVRGVFGSRPSVYSRATRGGSRPRSGAAA